MRLSELLGLPVTTEAGERLGRVRDVRAALGPRSLRVEGLVVGWGGVLERLGVGAPGTRSRIRTPDILPWSSVVRYDRRGVVVRAGSRNGSE
jgi:sporulation protein YlmC with PRC-barrel domain